MVTQPREKNPNWKGGRTIASNGYVLIKVGTHHHLSDVRGYAYEHRLIAEKLIGRRLRKGEQVHHRNGDRMDNSHDNIEVYRDRAHHAVSHRTVGMTRQMPGEPNEIAECACGCGIMIAKYDRWKRPRQFVSGHNMRNM